MVVVIVAEHKMNKACTARRIYLLCVLLVYSRTQRDIAHAKSTHYSGAGSRWFPYSTNCCFPSTRQLVANRPHSFLKQTNHSESSLMKRPLIRCKRWRHEGIPRGTSRSNVERRRDLSLLSTISASWDWRP